MERIQWHYRLARSLTWAICRLLGRVKVFGREHIPPSGALIVVCNHLSHFDPPILAGAIRCRQVYFMAKEELFQVPLLGAFLRSIGTFPVKRGVADRAALRRALETLSAGRTLGMFPEGHRSETGRLQPGEEGVGLIALRSRAPLLPVGIAGSNRVLPAHSVVPHFATVTVRIGRPFTLEDLYGRSDREAIAEATRRIMAAIQELLPPEHHPLINPAQAPKA